MRSSVAATLTASLAGSLVALSRLFAAPGPPPRPLPTLAPEAELAFEVLDQATGKPIPAKLTLLGVDGSPTPALTRTDVGRQELDAISAYNHIMSSTGIGAVRVPHGTYDVYVSRGLEWDLQIARKVRVGSPGKPGDGRAQVRVALSHAVQTPGWLSADFHVHAACSPDSRVPMIDRVYEFVADGVDLIVSTDHNVVCDYAPLIAELGVGRYLASATGDEVTTAAWGHFGAFPLPQDLERAGHGAVHVRGRTAAEMFHGLRQDYPAALLTVHHPRIDSEIGYFNLARFDARTDRAGKPGFSWDFDALEVLNGYQDAERKNIDRVIDDWFSLLNHGHIVTATGNSDTHHLTYNLGGYPRNYVALKEDDPTQVKAEAVTRAVRAHRSFFTTGPIVKLTVNGAGMGDVVAARGGVARADLEVQAAPWIGVDRVILYVGGQEAHRFTVPPGAGPVRFRGSYDLKVTKDSYVVLRVDGERPLWPVVGDNKNFDVRPLALTNPVFLDVDGNGVYDAPYAGGAPQRPWGHGSQSGRLRRK